MNRYTVQAKNHIENNSCTLVYCNETRQEQSFERGVLPLVEMVRSEKSMKGFYCADKVVGKAAAFMYVLLKPEELYAFVISEKAEAVLKKYGIRYFSGEIVPAVRNRKGDGFCPMETATEKAETPEEALGILEEKLKSV